METRSVPRAALISHSAGRKANEQECQAALRVAKEVITSMGLLPQTQVGAGAEGCPGAVTEGITPSQFLSPTCPCPHRWKSCPRATGHPSSSSSSPAGNEQQVLKGQFLTEGVTRLVPAVPPPSNGCTLFSCPCYCAIPVPVPLPIPSPCCWHSHPSASHL